METSGLQMRQTLASSPTSIKKELCERYAAARISLFALIWSDFQSRPTRLLTTPGKSDISLHRSTI